MNKDKRFEQAPRFSATGIATGSILAVIIALAIGQALDVAPMQAQAFHVAHASGSDRA